MKQNDDAPATKEDLKKFATKEDLKNEIAALETRTDIKMEERERKIDEKSRQYRDDVLTKLDQIMGELVNAREERAFLFHENKDLSEKIKNHDTRIKKLEQS